MHLKLYNHSIAGLLVTLLTLTPASVIAQAEEATVIPSDVTQSTNLQDTSVSADTVQSVAGAQETIPGDTLVQTADPSAFDSGVASSTVPIILATSTPETVPIVPDATSTPVTTNEPVVLEQNPVDSEPMPDTVPVENVTTPPDVVATMPVANIAPKKSFTFSIRAERIATEKVPKWQRQGVDSEKKKGDRKGNPASVVDQVQPAPDVTLDSVSGAPVISGSCSKTYYVILLYRNQTDYDTDPASYVINKAFPCTGGAYSFEMKDVPPSISDGTYYLLIGEMGETGSWTPITSLVPIDIAR